jgi:tetratricopeptide (TPR) repeat protein
MDPAGGSFGRAFALGSLGLVRLEAGDLDGALDALSRALAFPTTTPASLSIVAIWFARALEAAGRFDEALATIDRAVEVTGHSLLGRNARARRASVLLALGRHDEALAIAEADDMGVEAVAQCVRARLALLRGDARRAYDHCEEALALDARQPHTPTDHALTLFTRAEAAAALGANSEHALGEASAYVARVDAIRERIARS